MPSCNAASCLSSVCVRELMLLHAYFSVIYWAYKRLHSGLSETLRMRLRVLHSVTM